MEQCFKGVDDLSSIFSGFPTLLSKWGLWREKTLAVLFLQVRWVQKKRHFSQAEAHSTKEIGTMLQHFNIGACLQNLSVSWARLANGLPIGI